jgi:DNA repair exonuclease SbcCD ATPase subunit
MITLQNITLRNFLSIGQVTQAVDFDKKDLTLILGENLDLGGDGARNGTGKTTLIQGLSYALFGTPINNIRKDNLVNRTNGKAMLVTLTFNVNGTNYKIERGRKPNVLKFYVNDVQAKASEDQQGENKETQTSIEKVINMSHDMFRHIVVLNTYSEPFLALKNNEQKDIIEQLMGITLLSEKAEVIKEMIRKSKDDIQSEEFRVKAIEEANKRVKEQIDALKRRQTLWIKKHDDDLTSLALQYDELSKIDIAKELQAHKDLNTWTKQKEAQDTFNALVARSTAWQQKHDTDVSIAHKAYLLKNEYDIEAELKAWNDLKNWLHDEAELKSIATIIDTLTKSITKEKKLIDKLVREVKELEDHKCYACGQDFHDDKHLEVTLEKTTLLENTKAELIELETQLATNKSLVTELGPKPTPSYKTEADAIRHSGDVSNLKKVWENKKQETNPFAEQLSEQETIGIYICIGKQPITHYDTEAEAIKHSSEVANILNQIDNKSQETDPYAEQVTEMETQALQAIDFEAINKLTRTMEHQKFLLDLLTSKDSFVRKKIIDQNLSYLNARLTHYLDKIGLPHQVIFKNDLQVEITELGRELDFDNLSRGERNRLILGLSFAFRDVWESLYSPINTLFIDELIDSGLDTMGVENSLAILKDMSRRRQKSIWLVSHREELAGRVPNVLKVVKENGFTSYNTAVDIE